MKYLIFYLLTCPCIVIMFIIGACVVSAISQLISVKLSNKFQTKSHEKIIDYLLLIYGLGGCSFFMTYIFRTSSIWKDLPLFTSIYTFLLWGAFFGYGAYKEHFKHIRANVMLFIVIISYWLSVLIPQYIMFLYYWIYIWWNISPNSPWYGW